jgi:capsid protein
MVVRTFCASGENEAVKGAVHALGGIIAASMAAYNIAAWCYRREKHLGVNAIVYTLAVVWEYKQTAHHLERCEDISNPKSQDPNPKFQAA